MNIVRLITVIIFVIYGASVTAEKIYLDMGNDIAKLLITDTAAIKIRAHNRVMDEAPSLRPFSGDVLKYVKGNFTDEYIWGYYAHVYNSNLTQDQLRGLLFHLKAIPDMEEYFRTPEGLQLRMRLRIGVLPDPTVEILWLQENSENILDIGKR